MYWESCKKNQRPISSEGRMPEIPTSPIKFYFEGNSKRKGRKKMHTPIVQKQKKKLYQTTWMKNVNLEHPSVELGEIYILIQSKYFLFAYKSIREMQLGIREAVHKNRMTWSPQPQICLNYLISGE